VTPPMNPFWKGYIIGVLVADAITILIRLAGH
jgi:hypothetical protein